MHPKAFPRLLSVVMIIAASGCDNAAWEGIDVEVRPPPPNPGAAAEFDGADQTGPLELETVLYLVERQEGSRATAIPVAQISGDNYVPLPEEWEVNEFLERFPLERWEGGSELRLLVDDQEIGRFLVQSTLEPDASTCRLRPQAVGFLETRDEMRDRARFLAVARTERPGARFPAEVPPPLEDAALEARATNMVERVLLDLGAPWPASIPEARGAFRSFPLGSSGLPAVAMTLAVEDDLTVGPSPPSAYGLFILGTDVNGTYDPLFSWYQQSDEGGKAVAAVVDFYDLRSRGTPDFLLEVFGQEDRWFAVLGSGEEGWELLHQDSCGVAAEAEAVRSYP